MKNRKRIGLLLASSSLVLAILACSVLTGSEESFSPLAATNTPIPPPTEAPVEPAKPVETAAETDRSNSTPRTPNVPEGEIEVYQVFGFIGEFDAWQVVGMLMNNSERAVDNIEIEVEVFDAIGNSLHTEIIYASLHNLAPGEVSPFALWIWDELPDAEKFSATIVGYSATEVERADVELRGTMMTIGSSSVNITGEVVNVTNQAVAINDIAAAAYNASGELATAEADIASISYLDPGESGPFRVSMSLPAEGGAQIADYDIYTDIEFVESEDDLEITLLEESTYIDSDGHFHLVGELKNDSQLNLNISLVAALYDDEGKVLDADSINLPLYSLDPGEKIAYDFDGWDPINNIEGLFDSAESYSVQWDPGWTWETEIRYADISYVDGSYYYDEFWGLVFTGQVVNDTDEALDGGKVIITLKDRETGVLLAMGYEGIFEEIPARASVDYEIFVPVETGFDLDGFEYTIITKGELP